MPESAAPRLARLAPLFLLAAAPAALAAPQWSEPGGGPLTMYSSPEVEPPRSAPETVWTVELGEVLSEPAVQDGVLYVVAKRKRSAELVMIDVDSGSVLDGAKVPVHDFAEIYVDGTELVVVSGKKATAFDLRGGELKKGRSISGKWTPGAALLPGAIGLHDGKLLHLFDLKTGKELAIQDKDTGLELEGFAAWRAKPIVRDRDRATGSAKIVTLRTRHEIPDKKDKRGKKRETIYDTDAVIVTAEGLGTRDAKIVLKRDFFVNAKLDGDRDHQHVVGFPSTPELPFIGAFCNSKHEPGKGKDRKYHSIVSDVALETAESEALPVAIGELLICRKKDRSILSLKSGKPETVTTQDAFGDDVEYAANRQRALLKGEKAPAETRDGMLSGAGTVAFLGNWAIDVASGKVLWIAPDMTFEGRLIPAGDGMIVYSQGSRLVLASDSGPLASAGVAVAASGPVSTPGTGDAAILMDGRRIPGEVEQEDDGTIVVRTEGGDEPLRFAYEEVSALEVEGSVEVIENSWGAILAWRSALAQEKREALVPVLEEFARRRLVPEARALLEEIDSLGCPPEEKRRLEALLASKRDISGGTRKSQLGAAVKSELAVREASFALRVEAAEWLAIEGLTDEASALLADWADDWAGHDSGNAADVVNEVAADWVQEHFPDSLGKGKKRVAAWLPWARELVAAGAVFADHSVESEKLDEADEWRNECLVLQTDNIELFTTCERPEVIGSCLRYAEAGVRILQDVLDSPYDPEQSLMAVRLHAKRSMYLKEKLPGGGQAARWSAGFYIPSEHVSRFYVPDGENDVAVSLALQETLVHELVHQFQNERWAVFGDKAPQQSPMTQSFWVVEGFARFIEDQVTEMGGGAFRIDDPTAPCVEAASGLLEKKSLLEHEKHIEMNQILFGGLSNEDPVEIDLTSTLGTRFYGQIGIFYEQSGALVFFMMNRCGEEGRAGFIEYMTSYWRGKARGKVWKHLGFDSLEDYVAAFEEFLRDPAAE